MNDTNDEGTIVHLTLRSLKDRTPMINRLRRLLKAMLRGYGFRCERHKIEAPDQAKQDQDGERGNVIHPQS